MGSSSSKSEEARPRHFTQVDPTLLTTQRTNQRPTNTSTSRRVPNYVYQVPRDDSLSPGVRANSSVASSGSSIRPSGTTTSSSNASTTVSRAANSSVLTNASTTRPPYGSTTSSNASTPVLILRAHQSASSVSATNPFHNTTTSGTTANSSGHSHASSVSTIKSLGSSSSSYNTSSMNKNINSNTANNVPSGSIHPSESSGSFGSTQPLSNLNINKRNSKSKENISSGSHESSEFKKNAYQRRRANNANGDSQTGPRPHFNKRSDSGNRQNRNWNQRPSNMNSDNPGGSRTNNDSGNRHARSRYQRNVNSDRTEDLVEDKTKEVHDAFMKKLIGTFPPNYDKFRGLFCAACNHYELFIGRRPHVKHIDTQKHKSNMANNPRIRPMCCSTCKVMLHCDIHFLVAHKQSEMHMFISDQKPRSVETGVEQNRKSENTLKGDNTLNLKNDIKDKFLQRLDLSSEINDYSFYCHMCEQWFTSHEDWDAHLKNLHDSSESKKEMNMTFKNCQQCKVMMCGSKLLFHFHADSSEHDKFRTFLNIPSLSESDDDDDDDDDDNDTRDDVSVTSSVAANEQQSQKPTYLVLKNLPPATSKRDIFKYFKDFGHLENWEINPIGENTAVVQFRFGSVAENIVNSRFPLEMNGARFDACIQYF